ncbi:LysR family transcriptional regulator [Leisingera sp. ANG-Vp]|uniref:LysR family transcriptional regulator n=1 Tax=Leisingera sp. ANG-Vp TaxID=1577896 RepID=UPI00057CB367|nr:LysR family transcriptional regulator [Leisingera sp. ANG-Vp]KIC13896.1 LysR family transcriptional regulator [Leisingera sp. ANG-Vp]
MDWMSMPPMAALRAFAAFAESGNVVQAGAALNVSHAAISQQLRALEGHLGTALLDRSGRALALTAEGAHLARALQLGFGAIQAALQEISQAGAARPLHITCTPMFATHWLMPRLPGFQAENPGFELVLDPVGGIVELKPGGVDIALRYGNGNWPGLEAEMLLASPIAVIAAPELLDGRQVASPADLLDYPWLEELGTSEASHWLQMHGVQEALRGPRTQMPGNLLMQAVYAGQGVAVTVRHFVEADLASGRLVELFNEADGRGYHIATRQGVLRPEARKFIAWLRRERDAG